jgi:hypothetical protein
MIMICFYKLITVMENTIELNEMIEVELGDDTLTADPTPGSGVAASSECTPKEPVVVESESKSGDGDGAVSGVGAGQGQSLGLGLKVGLPPSKRRKGRRLQKS